MKWRRWEKETIDELAYELCSAFMRIQNPSRWYRRPYLTRKQIVRAYEAFSKHRGRVEWEREAVIKAFVGCACPVWLIWSSGFPDMNKKAGERITCEKCEKYFVVKK